MGEAVHAIVIPKGDAKITEAEVIAHCRTLIANCKLPRWVEFRSELFPLSGAGKVLERDLRTPFWHGRSRGVH
jgi:long-chain acyl-CoA synthetase